MSPMYPTLYIFTPRHPAGKIKIPIDQLRTTVVKMDGKLLGNEESISALLQVGVECVHFVWGGGATTGTESALQVCTSLPLVWV